jgi:hypothetical protein
MFCVGVIKKIGMCGCYDGGVGGYHIGASMFCTVSSAFAVGCTQVCYKSKADFIKKIVAKICIFQHNHL